MRRIRRPSHTTVVAYIALFLVLSGGTAVALSGSNTVFTDDIANDTQPASGGNPAGGLVAADLRDGSVRSAEVANGSLQDADLAPAARGARAYGRVSPTGTLTRSKNVASVSHPFIGGNCITLAGGIDPATAVLVVGLDITESSTAVGTDTAPIVEWRTDGTNCPAGTLEVDTLRYNGDDIDDDDGGGNTTGDVLAFANEPFTFVVP
jgi:hypothetical protein